MPTNYPQGQITPPVPREERTEVVASLRESGLSIRAIASGLQISDKTVQRDLAPGVVNDYTSSAEPEPVNYRVTAQTMGGAAGSLTSTPPTADRG
jgi:hypothetical protein